MESIDCPGFVDGDKALLRAQKVIGGHFPEGIDAKPSRHGRKRACPSEGLRGGSAKGGILADGIGAKLTVDP